MKLQGLLETIRLSEAPITDYSWNGPDLPVRIAKPGTRAMAKSPKAKAKIERVFQNTPWKIRVVFWNYGPSSRFPEALTRERYDLPMTTTWPHEGPEETVYKRSMEGDVTDHIKGIEPVPGEITLILNSDDGHDYVPFTPWMIAHRMGHALPRSVKERLTTIINDFGFDVNRAGVFSHVSSILHALGQFKSAREKRLGTAFEFCMECFAQFLIQGQVKFNKVPGKIPNVRYSREQADYISSDKIEFSYPAWAMINYGAERMEKRMNEFFHITMDSLEGRIIAV